MPSLAICTFPGPVQYVNINNWDSRSRGVNCTFCATFNKFSNNYLPLYQRGTRAKLRLDVGEY